MPGEVRSTRKTEVEQKASALFREKGYTATSMRDLAQHLGIEAASLYSHIRSKEELLRNTCFSLADELFTAMEMITKQDLSARAHLEAALQSHLEVITRDCDRSMVFLHEFRHLSEPWLGEFLKMRKAYEQNFMLILRKGIRNGEFRKIDEKITTLALLSAVNSTPVWYRKGAGVQPKTLATQLSDILINGLATNNITSLNLK